MANRPAFPTTVDENPSFAYTRTGNNVTQIDMTVNGVVYRKLLTYTGAFVDTESVWVKQ